MKQFELTYNQFKGCVDTTPDGNKARYQYVELTATELCFCFCNVVSHKYLITLVNI